MCILHFLWKLTRMKHSNSCLFNIYMYLCKSLLWNQRVQNYNRINGTLTSEETKTVFENKQEIYYYFLTCYRLLLVIVQEIISRNENKSRLKVTPYKYWPWPLAKLSKVIAYIQYLCIKKSNIFVQSKSFYELQSSLYARWILRRDL